jgi:hypothetical protein
MGVFRLLGVNKCLKVNLLPTPFALNKFAPLRFLDLRANVCRLNI